MHELSIAMSILDVAQEEVDRRGGVRISAIHLKMGAMSGVVSDALQSAYELAREQTGFEDCRLVIEELPVIVFCSKCQAQRPVQSLQWFCCAECDTPASDVVQGRELEICGLELAP
jgi:hydrogenase nickel incorporation protein HypA/HybF